MAYESVTGSAKPLSLQSLELAKKRMDQLLKPPGSLGELEQIALRLAAIMDTPHPDVKKTAVLIMAADHGVTEENVASAPKEFTALQTRYMLEGKTGVAVLAKTNGADLRVVDIGIHEDMPDCPGLIREKGRRGSGNLLHEAAMTKEETLQAIEIGMKQMRILKEAGHDVIGVGEMGIGNTTPTSAILHAFHPEIPVEAIVGKGAGLSEEAYHHKVNVIREAVQFHKLSGEDPLEVLQKVGGLDIAGMVGAFLGSAAYGVPTVIDGVISMVSAYVAWKIMPKVKGYLFASHLSAEPAYQVMADEMGLSPVLRLKMRLGEGSGCPLMFSLMKSACAVLNEMATFDEVGTSDDFLIDIREDNV